MYLKTANYHWNMEGPDFIQYHPWLGDVYSDIYGTEDRIAEYIRTLQAYTPASLARFQELTLIKDQIDVVQPLELFQQLLSDNQVMLDCLNEVFTCAVNENRQGIANYVADRIDQHSKWAWQIRATLKVI